MYYPYYLNHYGKKCVTLYYTYLINEQTRIVIAHDTILAENFRYF